MNSSRVSPRLGSGIALLLALLLDTLLGALVLLSLPLLHCHAGRHDQHTALLMHGDSLCTDDVRYQELRVMLRDPQWQQDFLAKPLAERELIARALREQSKEETQAKQTEIMDVNVDAVAQAFTKHGVSLMIHGHTHRPGRHDEPAGERWVLGAWEERGWYLEARPDGIELHNFDIFQ